VAERIATLGGSPCGTPGALVAARSWDDYSIGRDDAIAHLGALDVVYTGVIADHRDAIAKTEDPDPVTQDLLIDQAGDLEQYQWFVRAHLENTDGTLRTGGANTETEAARKA
jgi:starvation-inducible DNA-binding protein